MAVLIKEDKDSQTSMLCKTEIPYLRIEMHACKNNIAIFV